MKIDENHLAAFVSSLGQRLPAWVGLSPRQWGQDVLKNAHADLNLSNAPVSRGDLFTIAESSDYDDASFATAVLAWGGMRRDHGRELYAHSRHWLPIVGGLRNGQFESADAYNKFRSLRLEKKIPGMGPAYFTKLIFFAHPKHDGYIMDQWTARSANLLLGEKLVATVRTTSRNDRIQHTVSDKNTTGTYINFCDFIRTLSSKVDLAGSEGQVEEALFSTGRGKGVWRNYVIRLG